MSEAFVYKIFRTNEWEAFERSGHFEGSADDRRDGFIHLSAAGQIAGTLAKHYAADEIVVLARIAAAALGPALKWEASRGGALFPHLYAPLDRHLVSDAAKLHRGNGGFELPRWFHP